MSGARHRRKGNRVERELVQLHKALGVHAERYPLSGASRFRGSGHDIEIYVFVRTGGAPLSAHKRPATASFFVGTAPKRWCSAVRHDGPTYENPSNNS